MYFVVNRPALGAPESDLEELQRTHIWHFQWVITASLILIVTVLYHNASTVPSCRGAVGTFTPCLLLPHQLQVVLWSRVKIHWSAQRPPGKGRDPENYSEYIFLLSLHEQQG